MQDTDNNDNVERRGRSKSPKRVNQSKKSLSPGASTNVVH